MREAHMLSASEDERVVARQVKRAGSRSEQEKCVVQHGSCACRFGRLSESTQKPPKFLVEKLAIDSKVLPTIGILGFMGQLMGQIETDGSCEVITPTDTIFSTNLVSGDACGVRFEREEHQLKHGLKVLAWFIGR